MAESLVGAAYIVGGSAAAFQMSQVSIHIMLICFWLAVTYTVQPSEHRMLHWYTSHNLHQYGRFAAPSALMHGFGSFAYINIYMSTGTRSEVRGRPDAQSEPQAVRIRQSVRLLQAGRWVPGPHTQTIHDHEQSPGAGSRERAHADLERYYVYPLIFVASWFEKFAVFFYIALIRCEISIFSLGSSLSPYEEYLLF